MLDLKAYRHKRNEQSNLCLNDASTVISVKLEYTNILDENLIEDSARGSVNRYNHFGQKLTISSKVEDTQHQEVQSYVYIQNLSHRNIRKHA